MAGIVYGDVLPEERSVGRPVASFLLADKQLSLDSGGGMQQSLIPWCQVVCRGQDLVGDALQLRSGARIIVIGRLRILKPCDVNHPSDAVLVTLEANRLSMRESNVHTDTTQLRQ
ncbi:hypothetical protein BIU99_07890 [Plantibacter sp. MMLR14_011]|nr:hypothetical protein BIU99_07890 [Plantibacter sp. MMLR14_011]